MYLFETVAASNYYFFVAEHSESPIKRSHLDHVTPEFAILALKWELGDVVSSSGSEMMIGYHVKMPL